MTAFGRTNNWFTDLLSEVQGASTLAVSGVTTVYGKSFALRTQKSFGLMIRFTGTTKNVKVELEQSNTDLTAAQEGSSHADWGVGSVLKQAITDGSAYCLAVSPVVTKFARLKLTGLSGNTSDVVMDLAQIGFATG